MIRTLLLASAVLFWLACPALADDPASMTDDAAGLDAGESGDLTDDPTGADAGEIEGTDSRQAGDAPAGDAAKHAAGTQQITAGEIAKNPTAYYDKKVEVKAPVATIHGSNAFTLDEDAIFAGPDVLVIAPQFGTVDPKANVTVRGTVHSLVTAELEEEYTWFRPDSLQPDLLVRFKERPVIIAESVQTASGEELVKAGTMGDQPAAGDAPRPGIDEPETMDDDPLPMNQ